MLLAMEATQSLSYQMIIIIIIIMIITIIIIIIIIIIPHQKFIIPNNNNNNNNNITPPRTSVKSRIGSKNACIHIQVVSNAAVQFLLFSYAFPDSKPWWLQVDGYGYG